MNPQAKEFVPAHIMKRRQEEAERLGEQLNKVDIKSDDKGQNENGESGKSGVESSEKVQENSPIKEISNEESASTEPKMNNSTSANKQLNNHHKGPETSSQHLDSSSKTKNNNAVNDGCYPHQEIEDLYDESEDDRLLLEAGENICEFNGEQFIIPRDDDCEQPQMSAGGYDFGNDEDNEDEDVCNAFEEFLGNLPDQ